MKLFRLTTAIAMAFMALSYVDGNTASAGGFASVASGDWDRWQTWFNSNPSGMGAGFDYPGCSDNATVSAGHTVDVDTTVSVNNLTIEDATEGNTPGTVDMQDGGVLQICGSVTVETADTENGIWDFSASGGTTPIARAMGDDIALSGEVSLNGTLGGTFESDEETDHFAVTTGNTLSFIRTGGVADFTGLVEVDGTFQANEGDVTFSGSFDTTSVGTFKVSHASSTMRFNQAADTCFDDDGDPADGADFEISAGVFDIDQSVCTIGNLTATGGKIVVAAGEAFKAGLDDCP